MEAHDLSARSAGLHETPATPQAPTKSSTRSLITKASDFLQDSYRIGTFYVNPPRYRRYVDLKRNEMFTELVDIYTEIFKTHWNLFRRTVETFALPTEEGLTHQKYCARVYISAWFYDLYVSNRMACRKLSDLAYNEHYYLDLVHKSQEYDVYLTLLNAQIHPTNIKLTHEDTLYIPRINPNLYENPGDDDYFDIRGWANDPALLHFILDTFKVRKLMSLEPLSETATGRPAWLFDWHDDNLAYAWFPSEANYTFDDVTIAYILGVACTPRLAPRDYDEWQLMPGNIAATPRNYAQYRRIRPITYHGAIEIRTYEERNRRLPQNYRQHINIVATVAPQPQQQPQVPETSTPAPQAGEKQRKALTRKGPTLQQLPAKVLRSGKELTLGQTTSQTSVQEPIPEEEEETDESETVEITQQQTPPPTGVIYQIQHPLFREVRIIDFIYHARVINKSEIHSRVAAHRMLIKP